MSAVAQHDHGSHGGQAVQDSSHAEHQMGMATETGGEGEGAPHVMSGTLLPDVSMHRESSGTAWQPEAAPMEAVHGRAGGWNLMVHGNAFLRYNAQDVFDAGLRGDAQVDAPSWFMGMASRPVGRGGVFGLRGMFSVDPLITGQRGYPLLFQSGETAHGEPLYDRQHPHDLFSELAVSYGQRIGEDVGVFAYFGLPGEPALGPPAFMHRPSAMHLADSPVGHHWQDATHIVYGVATLGARVGVFKLDGSLFTGREPDENRYGIDRPRFDSYSIRLSANPNRRLALQASTGFLKSPEVTAPEEDEWRTTASAMYVTPARARALWSNTLVWGLNQPAEQVEVEHWEEPGHGHEHPEEAGHGHGSLHSLLLESDLDFGRSAFYTRVDLTQKTGHMLNFEEADIEDETHLIGTWTLGAAREVFRAGDLKFMIGAQGTVYRVPEALQFAYGKRPVSAQVYLRISPTRMLMGGGMPSEEHGGHDPHAGH